MLFANATTASAQLFHGISIAKNCTSPVTICDTDADCSGAVGECQLNHCDTVNPKTTNCGIKVTNNDDFGDTIRVNGAFDSINNTGGPTRNPAVGNLPIIAVSGNTTCTVAGALPCDLGGTAGNKGSVTFGSAGYNPTPADPNPLQDQANITIQDLCDAPGTSGCSTVGQTVQFGASTTLVAGCSVVNKDNSTSCTDSTPGDCKTAGCESGVCVQTHGNVGDSTVCTSTSDVAGDCGTPGCESGVCVADHVPVGDSTACTTFTGTPDECKLAGCEGRVCVANHANKGDSTSCTDSTPGDCKTAGCESGVCSQTHGNVGDSTACTSTSDVTGDCGTPGCEAGACVADHVPIGDSTPCTTFSGTPDECKTPGCEARVCVANHANKSDSTTCTDTDPTCGFTAGCEAGVCSQTHTPEDCNQQGCTPGFWKANFDKKGANAWPVPTNTLLSSVFTIPACLAGCPENYTTITLREALSLQGGKTTCQKAEILLRAAAAAYLNSQSGCVGYPISTGALIAEVNTALASCDSGAIITEATRLDGFNNLGCPLDQQGNCSNP
jgi:hypothetical protein